MHPRLNRIPKPSVGGPNDDSEAEPVVTTCALCDAVIDDGKSDPPPTIMRCPRHGPVCLGCCTALPPKHGSTQHCAYLVCDSCGEELKEGRA